MDEWRTAYAGKGPVTRYAEPTERCVMHGAVNTLRALIVGCVLGVVSVGTPARLYGQPAEDAGAGPPSENLTLSRLDAYIESYFELGHRTVERDLRARLPRKQEQTNRETRFDKRIGLQLGGSYLDPGFVTFGGEVSFAFTKNRYKEYGDVFDQSDRDHGYLLQYDLRANFFQGKTVSGSVYGIRHEDRINRRFQSTLDQDRYGFGTSWVHSHGKMQMELSYDYLETDRTGNADPRDDEHFTESTLRYQADWTGSERQRLGFSYEHAETKQEYQGLHEPFDTTRDLLRLEHQLKFGPETQHDVRTLVHWQEESGDFARDLFEIGPQLTLHHSDSLQTMYKYQFNRERYDGLDIETQRADFQLVHQLYTNLTTTVGVFGLYEDIEDDINTTQYGASIDWQYNRRNRFGHLYGNLALAYDTEEVSGDNGRRTVLNEAHAFRDPVAVILRNRNAVGTTIVVTDSANRRIYLLGVDYHVLHHGNVTRLTRIQTGRIADGDTVLIDYQFRTPARGQLDTVRVDFSLEQRFTSGLTPYYRLSYRNQEDDVSTGFLRRADRTNHHRLGANFETGKYTLGAEYEIFDDTIDPYDAFHVNGMLHVLQEQDHTVDASARLSRLFFEGGVDDRNVTMVDVTLDHRWRLTEHAATLQRLAYRFEDDSVDGHTHAWDVSAGLEYTDGMFSGELTVEYDRLALPDSTENNIGVFLRLRRELPNVLGVH